jgi:hypothetical protein
MAPSENKENGADQAGGREGDKADAQAKDASGSKSPKSSDSAGKPGAESKPESGEAGRKTDTAGQGARAGSKPSSEQGGQPSASKGPNQSAGRPGQGQGGKPGSKPSGAPGTKPSEGDGQAASSGGGGNRVGRSNENGPPPAVGEPPKPEPAAPRETGENVAPADKEQNLVLRTIRDLLKDDQKSRQLEQETGMSRDELEQFVKKFDKSKIVKDPSREGKTLDARPGRDKVLDPNRKLADPLSGTTYSSRSQRGPGTVPQDAGGGNLQGGHTQVPTELRARYEAYRSGLSRTPAGGGR